MQNPWLQLPKTAPFVLQEDWNVLETFNRKVEEQYQFQTDLFPDPFVGLPTAPVILLMLNPGFHETDLETHSKTEFAEIIDKNLRHQQEFYYSQDVFPCSGSNYWDARLRALYEDVGDRAKVRRNLMMMQYLPYHSTKFKPGKEFFSSQAYNRYLLCQAMDNEALIIQMRGKTLWEAFVPELKTYANRYSAKNPLSTYVSPKNISAEGYERIVRRISEIENT